MSLKAKRNILYISSMLVQILPLLIAFAINWDAYVIEKGENSKISMGISLTFGGILCAVLVLLSIVDKMPKTNGVFFATLVFIIICFLEPLLKDLKLLWGMFLLGKALDWIFFSSAIKKVKEAIFIEKNASETTKQVKEAMKEIMGEK